MTKSPTFGIDLGTTCSAIGLVRDGRPELIEIDGEALVPSVVSFPEQGPALVGQPALNRLVLDPERTIRSAKRFMGSDHRWAIDEQLLSAPEVSTLILKKLCRGAEKATGIRPERVVITVPAWFTQGQRADTSRAAELAGLELARLINEPTAAAMAHAHRQDLRRRALVYDFGGGTFDVSLVDQDGAVVEVRASHGDTVLGGDDLDLELSRLVIERLRFEDPELYRAVDASMPAKTRLLLAVQSAKHQLSSVLKAKVRVPFLLDLDGQARHLETELDREALESKALPLVERTLACVDEVLADAGVEPGEVDDLLLVGGSTRLPLVWALLLDRYGLEGNAAVPPDRAVALGAAIQAAIVDGSRVDGILIDVAPFSLSVAALTHLPGSMRKHLICRVVTPRNAPLPSLHTGLFYTAGPDQSEVHIPVMQGSHPNPLRNTALGEIVIDNLAPAPAPLETRPISVEFRHDLDGLVSIRVTDELSGRTVDGRVAAGGEEVADMREEMIEEILEGDVVPGDGSELDPFAELAADSSEEEDDDQVPAPASTAESDLEEARLAFDSVLAREKELAAEHPERIFDLRRLAIAGRDAHDQGETTVALERYDELSDQLFELGVWL